MPPTDDLLQDLRNEIAQGRVLVIVGSGVSLGATKGCAHASWTGLLESGIKECLSPAHPLPPGWADRLRENLHSGDLQLLLAAAQEISSQLGAPEGGEYRRWLRKTVGSLPLQDRTVLDALRDLPVILATTNYDGLLEKVTDLDPVTWRDRSHVERVFRIEDRGIVHLHGFWNEPESVILGLRSYEEISQDEHVQAVLRSLRVLRTFLFVGCGDGLADPNFGAFLRWSRGLFRTSEARHFRLCLADEVAQVQALHPPEERIFALPYGPDHASLGPFLRSLAPEPSESLGLPPRAFLVHHLTGLASRIKQDFREKTTYLPLAGREVPRGPLTYAKDRDPFVAPIHQVLLELLGRAQGGDSASAQIAAINRRSRKVRNILRALDRSPDPFVLLGEPGSGKTMTLQQAARTLALKESQRPAPRMVLYVRLGEFHVERAGRIGADDVRQYVRQASPPSLRPWISRLEAAGRLIIFFDGLDEMSRDRYGDHTEALSLFADQTRGKTKNIFSCRIADFSPRFIHRRLVLLPFDRPRVTRYLKQYILADFPLEIDGHLWSLEALAQRIAQGELPVQADNPFVLWLLCLYLQEERKWPGSRVELLRFYNETNYRRKQEELTEDNLPFPPMQAVFAGWARFAYQITERNRGVAIPIHLLAAGRDQTDVHEMIRVGKRCGVLAESREGHEHFVRFQHHRFQEYFAACHIRATHPDIDWIERLDAPRWQETLLNLILLGDEDGAAQALAASVDELTEICRREAVREEPEDAWESRGEEAPLQDEEETLLADRVELCSRILRQISSASNVRDTLMTSFRDAVQLLTKRGNPITQIKMMGVCLNVPEIARSETVRTPLQSPIHWVRNQALILLANHRVSERTIGSNFATEMGYDLANGVFPSRFKAYLQAVRKTGNRDHRHAFIAGSFCFALSFLLLFSAAGAIYYGAWSLRRVTVDLNPINENFSRAADSWPWQRKSAAPPSEIEAHTTKPVDDQIFSLRDYELLSRPEIITASLLLILLATGVTLRLRSPVLWSVVLGGSVAIATFGPLFITPWIDSADLGRPFLTLTWPFWFPAPFSVALLGAVIHFGSLATFLMVTTRLRHPGHSLPSFFLSGWKSCGFWSLFRWRYILPPAGFYGFLLVSPIFVLIISTVDYFLELPFDPVINALIIMGVPFLVFNLGLMVSWFLHVPTRQAVRGFLKLLGSLAAIILVSCLLVPVTHWLHGLPTGRVERIMAVFFVVALTLPFLPSLLRVWRSAFRPLRLRIWTETNVVISPSAWKNMLREADPLQQKHLLTQGDHQTLSLTPAEFLKVLRQIRPFIKEEPALSTYWDRRAQLEQGLRQEKQG